MAPLYLKTRDVADFLGLKTTAAVVRLIEAGYLPCERRRKFYAKGQERVIYRPTVDEVRAYLDVYDPALVERWDRERRTQTSESTHTAA